MGSSATVILSSPRKGANSTALALAMAEGFQEAGGTFETIDLSELDIGPCLACESCQRNGGKCVQADDMQPVYPKIVAADVLIMATPVYWFNMSAQLKIFLDRCFAVALSDEGSFAKKTLAAALAFGDRDPFVSGGVNAIRCFQDICSYTGAKWGGCVYGSAMERQTLGKDAALMAQARETGRALL